jgi:hypothetical protein
MVATTSCLNTTRYTDGNENRPAGLAPVIPPSTCSRVKAAIKFSYTLAKLGLLGQDSSAHATDAGTD